jgi:hypothetical protein
MEGRVPAEKQNVASATRGRPRVYLHIGEPKTGTTFLQSAMWGNRARLAAQGVLLPGYQRKDHSRASRDLRETPRADSDPTDPWIGEWDVLAGQAMSVPRAAVISDEVLSACNPGQADRAVRSLLSAEVHIVLVVRDCATLLPAEWQETVKTGGTDPWDEWLKDVIDVQSGAADRRLSRFWMLHDTQAILGMWSQHLPPEQVHVITMPRQGSATVLWERFAQVLGIDPGRADLSQARSNSSLGYPEAEFLRRLNATLPEDTPFWFYTSYIKHVLAHDVLATRTRGMRMVLPPEREAWARQQSETLVAALRDSKFHVVGDLDELLPAPAAGQELGAPEPSAEQILDAAVAAAAGLTAYQYRQRRPPEREPKKSNPRQIVSQLKWSTLNGSWTKRVLRERSHIRAVRRLRVLFWRILMRPAHHGR